MRPLTPRRAADAGLGVQAAAESLGLGFIPLRRERYDLVVSEEAWGRAPVRAMLDVIRSEAFQAAVQAMGGYDASEMGREIRLG